MSRGPAAPRIVNAYEDGRTFRGLHGTSSRSDFFETMARSSRLRFCFSSPARSPKSWRTRSSLRCTADTNVSSYPARRIQYGNPSRLRIKGIQMLGSFSSIYGHKGLENRERHAPPSDMPARIARFEPWILHHFVAWSEGTGTAEKSPANPASSGAGRVRRRWAGPRTDFTDVSYTAGHTIGPTRMWKEGPMLDRGEGGPPNRLRDGRRASWRHGRFRMRRAKPPQTTMSIRATVEFPTLPDCF